GVEEFRLGRSRKDGTELPSKIPGIGHGHVHALTGLGAVGMAGVARDEDPRKAAGRLPRRHVVEFAAETLSDLVDRPPSDVFNLNFVRVHDPVRDLGQLLWRRAPVAEHFVADFVQLDVSRTMYPPSRGIMRMLPWLAE